MILTPTIDWVNLDERNYMHITIECRGNIYSFIHLKSINYAEVIKIYHSINTICIGIYIVLFSIAINSMDIWWFIQRGFSECSICYILCYYPHSLSINDI